MDAGANGWLVVGEAPKSGGVILRVAGLGHEIVERRYPLVPARNEIFSGAGALWAADRVALLAAEDGASRALLDLSRQFSVASPSLSFLVLENPRDYLEAEIAPPANYPKELMTQYREYKAESDELKRGSAEKRLAGSSSNGKSRSSGGIRNSSRRKRRLPPSSTDAASLAAMTAAAPARARAEDIEEVLGDAGFAHPGMRALRPSLPSRWRWKSGARTGLI